MFPEHIKLILSEYFNIVIRNNLLMISESKSISELKQVMHNYNNYVIDFRENHPAICSFDVYEELQLQASIEIIQAEQDKIDELNRESGEI
ncbi:hypothetical protein VW03_004602 [Salmonella enterica subsp. enterica serovar Oranienburg]|nr:hypothetical protein [Salmonella enterica subsp. enterica serovar Oranienburg]